MNTIISKLSSSKPALTSPPNSQVSAKFVNGMKPARAAIFNPIEALSSTPAFKAVAAMQNIVVGQCAKCKAGMVKAILKDEDEMYFCEACRVVSPIPNN